jgi:tRNA acetyltransferase TAN1|tara:strand:- start:586 stop:1104 length:519 start_codon:yes stop_codon:yes gene_type:complete
LNLIVTCGRNLESEAKNEIKKIINELGDQELEIFNSGMRGILTVNTVINPLEVIDYARNKINEEPWFMRYCLRIIPIQIVTDTDVDKIKQNIIKFKDCIQKNDSFRITVEKRNSAISTKEIITEIAKALPNKVSLEKPTWTILIEVLGEKTGISILKNDGLFSLEKSKRNLE